MTSSISPLDELQIIRERYTLRSCGLRWSAYPGGLLHGGLGMALAKVAPQTFVALMGQNEHTGGPRPWWLLPPTDLRMAYGSSEDFTLDLFFANPDPEWLNDCTLALAQLGRIGLGQSRDQYRLIRHETVPWNPTKERSEGENFGSMLRCVHVHEGLSHIGVQLLTPARIKCERGLLRTVPTATVLVQRILARAAMLAGSSVLDLPLARQALNEAAQANITEHEVTWDDISRYSARQKAVIPLGGLTGWVRYSAECPLHAMYTWLAVGEWLHVGTKTTFGLGAYRLVPARTTPLDKPSADEHWQLSSEQIQAQL